MRNWIKTLLFLTAFSPVLISLAAVKYWNDGFGSNVDLLRIRRDVRPAPKLRYY